MNKFVLAISWWGDNDEEAKAALKFLTKHSEILHYQDLWGFILAKCKWGIIRFFYIINEWLAKLMPKVFDLKGLLHDAGFTNLHAAIINGGIVAALMGFFLTWAFFKKSLFPNSSESVKKIITQVFIAVILIAGTGSIIDTLFDISQQTYTSVTGETTKNDLAMTLIKNNTTDLFKVADNNWKSDKTNQNSLNKNNFESSDMSAVLSYKSPVIEDAKNKHEDMQYLAYRINYDTNGNQIATKIADDQGLVKVYSPGYARYSAKGIVLIPGLGALAIAKAFILYMTIYTILSIGIASLIAPLVYATDVENGKRTKDVISDLLKMIILIAALGIEYKFYVIALSYIADKLTDPLLYVLGLIAATVLLLFGSQKFLNYFGVDTSIKSSGSGLFKAAAATTVATRLLKGAGTKGKEGIKSFKERNSSAPNNGATPSPDSAGGSGVNGGDSGSASDSTQKTNIPKAFAKTAGYLGVRGVDGAFQDGTGMAKDKVADTSKAVVNGVKDKVGGAFNSMKEAYQSGQNTGVDKYSQHMGKPETDNTASETTKNPSSDGNLPEVDRANEATPANGANTPQQMTKDLPVGSQGQAAEVRDQQTRLPNSNGQAAYNQPVAEAQDTDTPLSPNTASADSVAANDKQTARQKDLNEVVHPETPATTAQSPVNSQSNPKTTTAPQEVKARQQTTKAPVPRKAPKTKAEVQRRLEEMNRG